MSARLTIARGPLAGRSFAFEQSITLGRSTDNGVVVTHAQVSSHHAKVVRGEDGGYLVEDLASRNGTFVAGSRVVGSESLGRLDTIDLGGAMELIFQVVAPSPAGAGFVPNVSGLADRPESPWALASGTRPKPTSKATTKPPPSTPATPSRPPESAPTPPADDRERTHLGQAAFVLPEGVDEAAVAEERERTIGGMPAALILPEGVEQAADEELRARTMGGVPADFVLPPEVEEALAADAAARLLGDASGRIPKSLAAKPPAPPPNLPPAPTPTVAPAPKPSMATPPPIQAVAFALEIHHEGGRIETVPLAVGEHVVGRAATCDVVIDKDALSRRHARLSIGTDGGVVVDLGSTNKTFVDGVRTDGEVRIRLGSTLKFGNVEAKLIRRDG